MGCTRIPENDTLHILLYRNIKIAVYSHIFAGNRKGVVVSSALSDQVIRNLYARGFAVADPFDEQAVQPASIDLRLGNIRYSYRMEEYFLGNPIPEHTIIKDSFDVLTMEPRSTVFIGLYEKLSIPPNTIGFVFPRSSITRLGISIVPTYMNPGYKGYMPITITNNAEFPVKLKPVLRVVQLVLLSLVEPPTRAYSEQEGAKYYDEEVSPSSIARDVEVQDLVDQVISRKFPSLYNQQ